MGEAPFNAHVRSGDGRIIAPSGQPQSIYDIPLVYLRLSANLACTKANATLTTRSPQLIYLYRGSRRRRGEGEIANSRSSAPLLSPIHNHPRRVKEVFSAQDAGTYCHSLLWPREPIHSLKLSRNTLSLNCRWITCAGRSPSRSLYFPTLERLSCHHHCSSCLDFTQGIGR